MAQHTRFCKDKELYYKMDKLYHTLDSYEDGIIYLDKMEMIQIEYEIEKIRKENKTEFDDIFRTYKRDENGEYISEVLTSLKDTLNWIENPSNKVSFKYKESDSFIDEKNNKELAHKKLKEFWNKYPNGIIYFG